MRKHPLSNNSIIKLEEPVINNNNSNKSVTPSSSFVYTNKTIQLESSTSSNSNESSRRMLCKFGYSGPNCEDRTKQFFNLFIIWNLNCFLSKECGLTIFTPNLRRIVLRESSSQSSERNANRILGGYEAWPHSWPSVAYIVFNYRVEVELPSSQKQQQQQQKVPFYQERQPTIVSIVRTLVCAGTLVGRRTGRYRAL